MKSNRVKEHKVKAQSPDSPNSGESEFVLIGKVRRPHGVEGEVVIESFSDFPERFKPGNIILVGEKHTPLKIKTRRNATVGTLIKLAEFNTPEEVGEIRNQLIYVEKQSLPKLPEGEYYHFELIGLQVFTEDSKLVGILNEVIVTGANDVYVVVAEDGTETLFPALQDVILSVNMDEKKMVVRPQEWL
jgi:16S rRNA processing protein RimM